MYILSLVTCIQNDHLPVIYCLVLKKKKKTWLVANALCYILKFAVQHLDYRGVQVACVTAPWFLSIFINMLPWESGQVPNLILPDFLLISSLFFSNVSFCYNSSQSVGCASVWRKPCNAFSEQHLEFYGTRLNLSQCPYWYIMWLSLMDLLNKPSKHRSYTNYNQGRWRCDYFASINDWLNVW